MSLQILMLLDNLFVGDPRVYKEATTLVLQGYKVNVVCIGNGILKTNENINGIEVNRILDPKLFKLKNRLSFKKMAEVITKKYLFDAIHCHDSKMLDLGVSVKHISHKVLIYDSHELLSGSPIHYLNNSLFLKIKSRIVRKLEIIIEKRNSKIVDGYITVGENIKDILKKNLNIPNKKPFEVIKNVPKFKPIINIEERNKIREELGFCSTDILMVFIGKNFFPGKQNIEAVLKEMTAPINNLHFVLIGGGRNQHLFKKMAKNLGAKNTHFISDINPNITHSYLCSMDIGLLPLFNKEDLSYWNALPNKIFDYFMAGLPVLTTSQPEYQRVIEKSMAGIFINPDLNERFLTKVPQILKEYTQFQSNALKAREILNWECQTSVLLDFYKRVVPLSKTDNDI